METEIDYRLFLITQCAAVRTNWSLIRVPAQRHVGAYLELL